LTPNTPPCNDVVESKNHALCGWLGRCSMSTGLLGSIGRIFLQVFKKKTCYELMHGRIPKVSHFHVFNCKCFILRKDKNLDKFDARSVDCIFLVMLLTLEAYHVLHLETNQIVETCEVNSTRHNHIVVWSLNVQVYLSIFSPAKLGRGLNPIRPQTLLDGCGHRSCSLIKKSWPEPGPKCCF
jgi:hypothetical protein